MKHLVTTNKPPKKLSTFLEYFWQSTSLCQLLFRTWMEYFRHHPLTEQGRSNLRALLCSLLFSLLHNATTFCLTWSTHIISWGLVHTVPWMTLLNYFAIAKYQYFRKSPTQPTMLREHPPREIFPSHHLLLIQILQNAMLHCRAMLMLWTNMSDHPETPCSSWLPLDLQCPSNTFTN